MKNYFKLIFEEKTNSITYQFIRYFVVGVITFVINFSIYYSLINFAHIQYLVSESVGFFISIMINYMLCRKWVFDKDQIKNTLIEINVFLLISLVGLGLTDTFLFIFKEMFHMNYIWAMVVASIIVMFWNFTGRRLLFYGRHRCKSIKN